MIVRIKIPINYYYGKDVYFQELYFDHSPTKEFVLNVLNSYQKQMINDKDKFGYGYTWEECIDAINKIEDWCFVSPDSYTHNNSFTETNSSHGRQPVSFCIIDIIKKEE